MAVAVTITATAGVSWPALRPAAPVPTVTVAPFTNESGRAAYDPVAPAVAAVVATQLGRLPGVQMMQSSAGVDARITGKVVLWDDHASVSFGAVDPATGEILWSGMAPGPTGRLPAQLQGEVAQLGQKLAPPRR